MNFSHIFTIWSLKDRSETADYLRLNTFFGLLSLVSMFVTYCLLKNLIELARNIEPNMESFERKYKIMVSV